MAQKYPRGFNRRHFLTGLGTQLHLPVFPLMMILIEPRSAQTTRSRRRMLLWPHRPPHAATRNHVCRFQEIQKPKIARFVGLKSQNLAIQNLPARSKVTPPQRLRIYSQAIKYKNISCKGVACQ
jgi:hypothetical protein